MFVSSIPDLFRLWDTLRNNTSAEIVWSLAHICQSMLSPTATPRPTASRSSTRNRPTTLPWPRCAGATPSAVSTAAPSTGATFAVADVSPVDFFHPSLSGQAKLAAVTWAAGYWPSLP